MIKLDPLTRRRYSFAIIMWEVLTRERPFPGMAPMQISMQVCVQGARPPVPDAPATSDIAELMTRCWAPEPSERPAFAELADLLKVRGNDGAYSAPPTGAHAPARAPMATSAKGRFCTECGEPRTGSKFCGNCGNRH